MLDAGRVVYPSGLTAFGFRVCPLGRLDSGFGFSETLLEGELRMIEIIEIYVANDEMCIWGLDLGGWGLGSI